MPCQSKKKSPFKIGIFYVRVCLGIKQEGQEGLQDITTQTRELRPDFQSSTLESLGRL